jgi:hypothetical protein
MIKIKQLILNGRTILNINCFKKKLYPINELINQHYLAKQSDVAWG